MDVDPYLLAYYVFHYNWKRFGIPEEDIPPPTKEDEASLDSIIPVLSTTSALFQISSRNDWKYLLDTGYRDVHDINDVYTRVVNAMKIVEDALNDPVNEDLSGDSAKEAKSQDTTETYLSDDDIKEEDLPEEKEMVPHDAVKEGLLEDAMARRSESMQEDLSKNMFRSEDIPCIIVYSLAVCTELVLYDKNKGKKEVWMKDMPKIWEKYFNDNLKRHCEKARLTKDHLKAFSDNHKCPERFLNKFLNENKEYDNIASKFSEFTQKNLAVESPEHVKVLTKVGNPLERLSFQKIIQKFKAAIEICKCAKGTALEEMEVCVKTCSSSSTSTTPSN